MLKIYTRTGDKGQTSLFGGKRVPKTSLRIEVIGAVDELNSVIGIVITQIQNLKIKSQKHKSKVKNELIKIQHDLFDIGSVLAKPGIRNNESGIRNLEERVKQFEKSIDEMTERLPRLQNFILPGGGKGGSLLHFARTVCRRAERRIVALSKKERVHQDVLSYFNRLSDLLFTMARFVNSLERQRETIWTKSKV